MKKSSSIIIASMVAALLIGVLCLDALISAKKKNGDADNDAVGQQTGMLTDETDEISFGEYKYEIEGSGIITAKYIKSGNSIKLYSVFPVEDSTKYDISSDGSAALYLGKDRHIWVLYNNGTSKRITPDQYGSLEKFELENRIPGYIWADNPSFSEYGTIEFVSNLPESDGNLKKSIWEIDMTDGTMSKIYTLSSESYDVLGYRDDGKLMILDGNNISVVNLEDSTVESIDVSDKYVLNVSTDGTKIIYMKRGRNNQPDFSGLYKMNSNGKEIVKFPDVQGYNATPVGVWDADGLHYAYVIRNLASGGDKIAVADFSEGYIKLSTYEPETEVKVSDEAKLRWSNEQSISIDTGDDIINVEIK